MTHMTFIGIRMLVDQHQKVQWHHCSAEASIALRADPDLILAAVIFSVTHVTQVVGCVPVSLKIREFPKFETPPYIYLFSLGTSFPIQMVYFFLIVVLLTLPQNIRKVIIN